MTIVGRFPPNRPPRQWEIQRRSVEPIDRQSRFPQEWDHLVRALSHDMTANFMLLEGSYGRLKGLLAEPLSAELQEAVVHVEACLRESKRFLEDLVNLAKTGRVDMEATAVEVDKTLDAVLFEQRDLLAQKGVRVEARRPLPTVWCNEHRLKQVLTNLIRNAVRHGCNPQNPQIIISTAESRTGRTVSRGRRLVLVRVYDNGPGIDPKYKDEVFLPGRRLPTAIGEGSGMGLAIAKKIVEYYGGSIYVDEACRDGTAIVFSLPVAPAGGVAPQPLLQAERKAELHPRRLTAEAAHHERDRRLHQPISRQRRNNGPN